MLSQNYPMQVKKMTALSRQKCIKKSFKQWREGDYMLPVATIDRLGGIKIGELLTIDETGKVSAVRQSDVNFSLELKRKTRFTEKNILQEKHHY